MDSSLHIGAFTNVDILSALKETLRGGPRIAETPQYRGAYIMSYKFFAGVYHRRRRLAKYSAFGGCHII